MPNLTPTSIMMYYNMTGVVTGTHDSNVTPLTPGQKRLLATRYDWIWLFLSNEAINDPTTLTGEPLWGFYFGLAKDLKAINPNVKVGMYIGGVASPDFIYHPFHWANNSDLMHDNLGNPAIEFSAPISPYLGGYHQKLLNITNSAVRRKMVRRLTVLCKKQGLDGIYVDSYDPGYYASWSQSFYGLGSNALEGDVTDPEFWMPPLQSYVEELRDELAKFNWVAGVVGLGETGRTSGPVEDVWGFWNSSSAEFGHEIIAEYVARAHANETYFVDLLTACNLVRAKNRRLFYFWQPRLLDITDPAVGYSDDTAMRRKALGCYLLIKYYLSPTAFSSFGYHGTSLEMYRGYDTNNDAYVYDSTDWDLVIGEPTGDYQVNTAGTADIYWREYILPNAKNVYVVVNISRTQTGVFGVNGSYKDWHPTTGTPITVSGGSYTIAAGATHLLFEQ